MYLDDREPANQVVVENEIPGNTHMEMQVAWDTGSGMSSKKFYIREEYSHDYGKTSDLTSVFLVWCVKCANTPDHSLWCRGADVCQLTCMCS